MRWELRANVLFGTREDAVYRLLGNREAEADTAGEAVAKILAEAERLEGRPVLGLWDLGISSVQ